MHANLAIILASIENARAEKDLFQGLLIFRIDDFTVLQFFGEVAHAPINLTQAFFIVYIIAVFAAVTIAGGPAHDLTDFRPLVMQQPVQLL